MPLPTISGEYRFVADPEIVFGKSGTPMAKFRLVASSRKREGDKWVDDKVVWLRAIAFNRVAEHVVGTFKKGDLAVVIGKLQTESWEKDDGSKGEAFTVVVDSIGPSLAFVEATMNKVESSSNKAADNPWESGGGDAPPF